MTGLVVVAGVLAVASGLLKLFGKGRGVGGISPWALVELLVGVVVPLYVLRGHPSPGVLSWVLFLTLGLILASSLLQVARVRTLNRHRETTESARLVTYVKYLSSRVTPDGRQRDDAGG